MTTTTARLTASFDDAPLTLVRRRWPLGLALLLLVAFVALPLLGDDYWLNAILIPFLVLSLAGLGLNLLTGYTGQTSVGAAGFMAVGAFATYGLLLRVPGIPLPLALVGNELPLVSCDFNGYPASCVVDLNHTRVQGELVKVLAWYDNEWAFANRMLDVMVAWLRP